uniref:Putative methyltransferase n=1 Tax=viral metagenome TaxID=1070528 RepID=A0A6H1ZU25_9ZZZZ
MINWIKEIQKYNKTSMKMLDVGCSFGKYIKDMRDYGGFSVTGVELNEEMCKIGREKFGLDIRQGDLLKQNFDNSSFDIVIMSHIIEHLYNPRETVEEVYRILSSNGLVLIRTPNTATLEIKIFGKYWFPFDAPRHIVLFNEKNLRLLLSQFGFTTRKVIYEKTPNNIILSIKNYLIDKKHHKAIIDFFSLNNYFLLALFTPISFILGLLKTSGRITILAQKNELD